MQQIALIEDSHCKGCVASRTQWKGLKCRSWVISISQWKWETPEWDRGREGDSDRGTEREREMDKFDLCISLDYLWVGPSNGFRRQFIIYQSALCGGGAALSLSPNFIDKLFIAYVRPCARKFPRRYLRAHTIVSHLHYSSSRHRLLFSPSPPRLGINVSWTQHLGRRTPTARPSSRTPPPPPCRSVRYVSFSASLEGAEGRRSAYECVYDQS